MFVFRSVLVRSGSLSCLPLYNMEYYFLSFKSMVRSTYLPPCETEMDGMFFPSYTVIVTFALRYHSVCISPAVKHALNNLA